MVDGLLIHRCGPGFIHPQRTKCSWSLRQMELQIILSFFHNHKHMAWDIYESSGAADHPGCETSTFNEKHVAIISSNVQL